MRAIKTAGVITSIRSNKDRSLGFSVSTPELSSQEKALFMELQNINCQFLIEPESSQSPESYQVNKDLESKTPSQRLRNVLYVWWEQSTDKSIDFDTFYRQKMETFIELVKRKLEG